MFSERNWLFVKLTFVLQEKISFITNKSNKGFIV